MIFANLIASCLLACGVASSSVRVSDVQTEVQKDEQMYLDENRNAVGGAVYTVNGGYGLSSVLSGNFSPFFDDPQLFDDDINLLITNYPNSTCTMFSSVFDGNSLDASILPCYALSIVYSAVSNSITVTNYFNHDLTDLNHSVIITIYSGFDFTDTSANPEFCIYFNNAVYLTDEQYSLFSVVFSNDFSNTNYFSLYTGWYTFYQPFPLNSGITFCISCSVLYNNMLCNSLYANFNSDITNLNTVYVSYTNNADTGYFRTEFHYIMNMGELKRNTFNVYLNNALIPSSIKTKMDTLGTFSYTYGGADYSLTDLFINIADTPIQFVTGLFSFELFGTTFSTAFLGIITVIAMIFILRKVI